MRLLLLILASLIMINSVATAENFSGDTCPDKEIDRNLKSSSTPDSDTVKIVLNQKNPTCQTAAYGVTLNSELPVFDSLWIDSLQKGRSWPNAMADPNKHKRKYKMQINDQWVRYHDIDDLGTSTSFHFEPNRIRVRSESSGQSDAEPFVLRFNLKGPKPAYATVLGHIPKFPAILHIPGQGTVRITARSSDNKELQMKYYSGVSIVFPAANKNRRWVEIDMEIINSYPKIPAIENDPHFDGYRRCWLNILQINPGNNRTFSNNSSSSLCGSCYHEYSEIAMLTPQLAQGLSIPAVLRDSLDQFIAGIKAYGMPTYPGSDYTEPMMDTYPALLIASHQYYQASHDKAWIQENIETLLKWARYVANGDKNGNGLIEYHQSGNFGQWKDGPNGRRVRPANWWDCINFGYEDAYSNALAYRALRGVSKLAKVANRNKDAERFSKAAKKLKASYYPTFYNPETVILAGWKSRDGQLHDYAFTFIQGLAITYGLVDDTEKANALMDAMLLKMKEVGFTRFELGIPGNLVNVPAEDYYETALRWGGSNNFQVYENGSASANHAYFTLAALYKLGRKEQADKILFPILDSFNNCRFQGHDTTTGLAYDWQSWDGTPRGYEGILTDNYLAVKAVLVRQGLVDPEWGYWK